MPDSLPALAGHELLGYDTGTPGIRAVAQRYPARGRNRFALMVDSDVAQLVAIRAGFGIGICQVSIAIRESDLVRVLPDPFALDLETWVVMHENLRRSARCRAVFEAFIEQLTRQVGG